MKFYKKLSGLVLAAALVVGSTSNVFAATNSELITALKSAGATTAQISAAETYLNANQVDASKLDVAKAEIDEVAALKTAKGVSEISQLSEADKLAVVSKIKAAAVAVGLNATLSTSGGKSIIILTDSNGKEVASIGASTVGTAMKTTGTNNGDLIAVGGTMIALAAAALAFRKKELN